MATRYELLCDWASRVDIELLNDLARKIEDDEAPHFSLLSEVTRFIPRLVCPEPWEWLVKPNLALDITAALNVTRHCGMMTELKQLTDAISPVIKDGVMFWDSRVYDPRTGSLGFSVRREPGHAQIVATLRCAAGRAEELRR